MFEQKSEYKKTHDFAKRLATNKLNKTRHPNKQAVIVETFDEVLELKKNKYLMPLDATMGSLQFIIRKKIKNLKPEEALFFFVNKGLVASSQLLSELTRDSDGNLYVLVQKENCFGAWAKSFQSAEIQKVNELTFVLKIKYSWYFIYNFEETFIFKTLSDAKSKLLQERSQYRLKYIEEGVEKNLNLLNNEHGKK